VKNVAENVAENPVENITPTNKAFRDCIR